MNSFVLPPGLEVDYTLPSVEQGYPDRAAFEDTTENFRSAGMGSLPDSLKQFTDPSTWRDRARELDKYDAWPKKNRFTNQHPTHECTTHSLVQGLEWAYNATRTGDGMPVLFSPISVYAEANPRQWGGAGCLQVLRIAAHRGILPEHASLTDREGQKKLFKHTLHATCGRGNSTCSSGRWVRLRDFPEGWEQTAQHFKPNMEDVINPATLQEMVACLLAPRVVNVGRKGHAIPYFKIGWDNSDGGPYDGLYFYYWDSYDIIRADSLRTARQAVGGSSSVWQMTVPDDWNRPAGDMMLI